MEDNLHIVEVVSSNIQELWPHMLSAVRQASFIALDMEMTGLGEKKKVFNKEIDMRYKYTAELARSHAPVSLGISCFCCTHTSSEGEQYSVESFDLLVLSELQFCVESRPLKFLRCHGFDFNKLVDDGLPYSPGCDLRIDDHFIAKHAEGSSQPPTNGSKSSKPSTNSKSASESTVSRDADRHCTLLLTEDTTAVQRGASVKKGSSSQPNVRALFSYIIKHQKPIVLHNGLVDLAFMYQHFYTELPKSSETFAANLCEMFPMGIYDTKYFSEFVYRDPASYLQIIYLQERLLNTMASDEGRPSVDVHFTPAFSSLPGTRQFFLQLTQQRHSPRDATPMCRSYAYYGWCDLGELCPKSHDLQRIVRQLMFKPNQSGGRKLKSAARCSSATAKSIGTNAMLVSALQHNTRHRQLMEQKKSSGLSHDGASCLHSRESAVPTSNGESGSKENVGRSDSGPGSRENVVPIVYGDSGSRKNIISVSNGDFGSLNILDSVAQNNTDENSSVNGSVEESTNGETCRCAAEGACASHAPSAELSNVENSLCGSYSSYGKGKSMGGIEDSFDLDSTSFSITSSPCVDGDTSSMQSHSITSNSPSTTKNSQNISCNFTGITHNSKKMINGSSERGDLDVRSTTACAAEVMCSSEHVTTKCSNSSVGVPLGPSRVKKRSLSSSTKDAAEHDSPMTSSGTSSENEQSSVNFLENGIIDRPLLHKRRLMDVPADVCKRSLLDKCQSGLTLNGPEFLTSKNEPVLDPLGVGELNSLSSDVGESTRVNQSGYQRTNSEKAGVIARSAAETAHKLGPLLPGSDATIVPTPSTDIHGKSAKPNHPSVNEIASNSVKNDASASPTKKSLSEGHSAAIDAYKTGFIFASYIRRAGRLRHPVDQSPSAPSTDTVGIPLSGDGQQLSTSFTNARSEDAGDHHPKCCADSNTPCSVSNGKSDSCGLRAACKLPSRGSQVSFTPQNLGLSEEVNKVYLVGKSFPFLVQKSPFAKPYKNHLDKIKCIKLDEM